MEIYNNQFKYLELRDGSVIIIKYIGADNNVTVPAEINGKPVTEIDDDAFAGRDNLKVCISSEVRFGKVSFAPNVTASNVQADPAQFKTARLPFKYGVVTDKYTGSETSIKIPATINDLPVIEIGDNAFRKYRELTSITIPDGVERIGDAAFLNCNLTSINIPNSVTKIGTSAFYGCSSLTSLEIPSGVQEIGECAFMSCSSLESIKLPEKMYKIDRHAFYGCSSLTSINIPSNVKRIEYGAFSNCISLASIKIPYDTKIDDDAFRNCPARIIRY